MKFSIIIPVYNVAAYLRECLDSVLEQTLTDWEAICVDDGSTDGSGAILDEYAAKDRRFRVIHQKNAGVCAARQVGLELTRGKYVCAVDPDDWVEKDYFERLVKHAELTGADIVWGGFTKEEVDGSQTVFAQEFGVGLKEQILPLLSGKLWGTMWQRAYRRDFLLKHNIRFPTAPNKSHRIVASEDSCFALAAIAAGATVAYAGGTGYHYRIRLDSALHRGLTAERCCSKLLLCEILDQLLPFEWVKEIMDRGWQKAALGAYQTKGVSNEDFIALCGGVRSISGIEAPIHHKIMYWLAVRGFRTQILFVISTVRGVRKQVGGFFRFVVESCLRQKSEDGDQQL